MINRIIRGFVSVTLHAVGAFLRGFTKGFIKGFNGESEPDPEESEQTFFDADSDDLPPAIVQAIEAARSGNMSIRTVHPFAYHMSKFFDGEGVPTRSEAVENMLLSLESLGKEIEAQTSSRGTVTSKVEREVTGKDTLLHGHLDWRVDKHSPNVYAISMDLLRDGFIFRADTRTFVITGKMPK